MIVIILKVVTYTAYHSLSDKACGFWPHSTTQTKTWTSTTLRSSYHLHV